MRALNLARRVMAALKRQPAPKVAALRKREMERRLQARGMSRSEARRTTVAHFADPPRKESEGGES